MKLKQKIERHFTSYAKTNEVEKKSFNTNNTLNQKNNIDMETRNNTLTEKAEIEFSLTNYLLNEEKVLRKADEAYFDTNRKNFVELGYNCTDPNLIDKRGILAASIAGKKQLPSESLYKPTGILQYCKNYENMVCSCKVPNVEELNPQWLGETANISISDPSISGLYFTPRRLGTVLNVSKMFLKQGNNIENELIGQMNEALENKLIKTIFSDYQNQGTNDPVPSGIFNSSNEVSFTNIDDVISMPESVQTTSGLGYYVISPKAKKEILKLDETAFLCGNLFGENYLIEPLMKDGLIAYVDLRKLLVCSWNYVDITNDFATLAHLGQNLLYLTGYYDYNLVSDGCAKWLNMSASSGSGE